MAKLPLYHQTAHDGRGGIPGWWFGAPVIAFANLATDSLGPLAVTSPGEASPRLCVNLPPSR
jgi:hypothetical protein